MEGMNLPDDEEDIKIYDITNSNLNDNADNNLFSFS